MDTCIGIVGKDYVLLATDAMTGRSIMIYTDNEDKSIAVNKTTALAMSGPQGDRVSFGEFIRSNVTLNELRSGHAMSTHAVANYTREQLAEALRSNPKQVNILLAGVDEDGPALYYMDYLASMNPVKFGCHGHASSFTLSIFDRHWTADMDLEAGKALLQKAFSELKTRFLINLAKWKIKVITKDGIEEIEL
jgi:20S proteasome subunit beta 4